MLGLITIKRFSYVADAGFHRLLANVRNEASVSIAPKESAGIKFLHKTVFDEQVAMCQDMERVHHHHAVLLHLAHVDHPSVDELLFRGAASAPSEDTALYMTQLLAARMKTATLIASDNQGKRLCYMFRLCQKHQHFQSVAVQAIELFKSLSSSKPCDYAAAA